MRTRQRLAYLLIAAVIAIAALLLLIVFGGDEAGDVEQTATPAVTPAPHEGEPAATATPTETATATRTPTATPKPKPPPLLANGRELEFTEGERVRFRVRSAADEELHVHGYDITRDLPAGRTVIVSFEATITGIFEAELHGSGEMLGTIRVNPD